MYYLKTKNQEYERMTREETPPTNFLKTLPAAFLTGGIICSIGQMFIWFYEFLLFSKEDAMGLSSCTIIFITAILTGLNVFDNIAAFAGAGTLVPITGFANAVASTALEFKREGLIQGLGAKMFSIAGPVIVYGLFASFIYGICLYIFYL